MKFHLPTIQSWLAEGEPFAIARVIKTWGASPRPVGSIMLIKKDMTMVGSVSGGCIEGEVLRQAMEVLESNVPQRLDYGISNEEAWSTGLSCGGRVSVWVEPFWAFAKKENWWGALETALGQDKGCVLVSSLNEATPSDNLLFPDTSIAATPLSESVHQKALEALQAQQSTIIEQEDQAWFIHVFPPKPQLLIIGAAHIAVDLVELAQSFGFSTSVIDPRGIFTQKTTFPTPPDQLLESYPAEVLPNFALDANTYAVILSHDPKIDDNALEFLLPSRVRYIGALGSRKTQAKRVARLEAAGFSTDQIGRIHAPIGLAIGAKGAREIALSIMAELIKIKNESSYRK
ncbi:MAG: XdhC family protein [Bacteroidota bacterium]